MLYFMVCENCGEFATLHTIYIEQDKANELVEVAECTECGNKNYNYTIE